MGQAVASIALMRSCPFNLSKSTGRGEVLHGAIPSVDLGPEQGAVQSPWEESQNKNNTTYLKTLLVLSLL